jgi:hypothetical protein
MSVRNSTASIFRTAEHVFYESAANELGTIKALIFYISSGGFISTSVSVSHSQFSFTIVNNPPCCEVSRKENTVHTKVISGGFHP